MNIQARIGNTTLLTKEAILDKVNDYAIFSHYIGQTVPLRRAFRSPLHDDRKPSFWVISLNGKLIFKDFTLGITGDCFKFVRTLFNEDFFCTLRRINKDFNLGLIDNFDPLANTPVIHTKPDIEDFEYSVINYRPRTWNSLDREYWNQYKVSFDTLVNHCVVPISHFWIDGKVYIADAIAYAYNVNGATKIYQPYSEFNKWRSNQSVNDIFGIECYDPYADILLFTKSNKDLMCFNECGYTSLAVAAENSLPSSEFFEGIFRRHSLCILFWDNDYNKKSNWGQINALRILGMYPKFVNLYVPTEYHSKDFSDFIHNHGFNTAKSWLNSQLDTIVYKNSVSKTISESLKMQGL
jgi:hypothetical protein